MQSYEQRLPGYKTKFSYFKAGCFNCYTFRTGEEVKHAVQRYIHFYNHQRFQQKLDNLSPYEYRTQVALSCFLNIVYLTGVSSE
ncbi:IS3 family transposase [Paenibacillus massiliensis]|uniref:IS3 family transposase n=1 Tax=Paenibacillus massiliensis TaxID=225917 RepID=UPI0009DB0A22